MNGSWWVTPSGTTVQVGIGDPYKVRNHDAIAYNVVMSSTGGEVRDLEVRFVTPRLADVFRDHQGLPALSADDRASMALVAGLRAVDERSEFFEREPDRIDLGPGDGEKLLQAPYISDQGLRRYIVRRLYLVWRQGSFDDLVRFSDVDAALTGGDSRAFLRNLQLLEQEGLVELQRNFGTGFEGIQVRATADLVRAVERYGAAPNDVETAEDYLETVSALPPLRDNMEAISLQRGRYETARSTAELMSVFQSVAPIVESTVNRLLVAHGSQKQHPNLGPMIGEIQQRGLGGRSLVSQLNALKNNARDIALHGDELPPSVLRIATEVCFELLPQLARLFP